MRFFGYAMVMALCVCASAIDPDVIEDAELQARYEKITEELRCLVCQNQTIADSNAELAVDLRRQVRKMLEEGASDDDIRVYMSDRYGDFVLYKPPLTSRTAALWFGPVLLLIVGLIVMARVVGKHRASAHSDGN